MESARKSDGKMSLCRSKLAQAGILACGGEAILLTTDSAQGSGCTGSQHGKIYTARRENKNTQITTKNYARYIFWFSRLVCVFYDRKKHKD